MSSVRIASTKMYYPDGGLVVGENGTFPEIACHLYIEQYL